MTFGQSHALAAGIRAAADASLPLFEFGSATSALFGATDGTLALEAHAPGGCPVAGDRAVTVSEQAGLAQFIDPVADWDAPTRVDVCSCLTKASPPDLAVVTSALIELGLAALGEVDADRLEVMSRRWDRFDLAHLAALQAGTVSRVAFRHGSVWSPLDPARVPTPSDPARRAGVQSLLDAAVATHARAQSAADTAARRWPAEDLATYALARSGSPSSADRDVVWVPVFRASRRGDSKRVAQSVLGTAPVVAMTPGPGGFVVVALTGTQCRAVADAVPLFGAATPRAGMTSAHWQVAATLFQANPDAGLEAALSTAGAALAA